MGEQNRDSALLSPLASETLLSRFLPLLPRALGLDQHDFETFEAAAALAFLATAKSPVGLWPLQIRRISEFCTRWNGGRCRNRGILRRNMPPQ